jgi:hypothetical protein
VTSHNVEPPFHSDRYYNEPTLVETSPVRRKKHRLRHWLIALVVLIALLAVGDRIAVRVAQNELATKIAQDQDLSQKPTVTIDGFPFLTQAVSRNFPHATIDIRGLAPQGVPISDLHVDLRGVHVSSGYNSATVDNLTATAELSYADLSKLLSQKTGFAQVQLSDGGNGQVKASISFAGLFTTSVEAQVTRLPGNIIEIQSGSIKLPVSGLAGSVPSSLSYKFPVGNLPFGLTLSSVTIGQSGVDIVATGQNVSLSQTTAPVQ